MPDAVPGGPPAVVTDGFRVPLPGPDALPQAVGHISAALWRPAADDGGPPPWSWRTARART